MSPGEEAENGARVQKHKQAKTKAAFFRSSFVPCTGSGLAVRRYVFKIHDRDYGRRLRTGCLHEGDFDIGRGEFHKAE